MKISIIFHSYSGITRGIAGKIQAACGGDLIEVKPEKNYTKITAYTIGCIRARNGEADPVDPAEIDVGGSDLIVIGTPVWAWKASPVANGAIHALQNSRGKKAIIFATCGSSARDTLPFMKKALGQKGVDVVGEFVLARKDVTDERKVGELVNAVKAAAGIS